MTKLSVNINKIAVVRNSRGGNLPDAGIEKLIKMQECNDTIIKGNIVHETDY